MKDSTLKFLVGLLGGISIYHTAWWTYIIWKAKFNGKGYICLRFDRYGEHIPEMIASATSLLGSIGITAYLLKKLVTMKKREEKSNISKWLLEMERKSIKKNK